MAFNISKHIISSKFYFKNTFLSRILIHNRQFCSKDDETNNQNSISEDNPSKTQEKLSDKSSKSKKLSHGKAEFSEESKAAAKQKLMSLLSDINISSEDPVKAKFNLNLARPVKRPPRKQRLEKMIAEQVTPEHEMNTAVKAVASSFKDDPEKIESELNQKLSSLNFISKEEPEEIPEIKDPRIDNEMSENLMSSVKEVAATMAESPIPPRSKLTQRLLRLSLDKEISPDQKKSMRSVIETMKFESKPKSSGSFVISSALGRRSVPRQPVSRRPASEPSSFSRVGLFEFTPLNMFKLDAERNTDSGNEFWQKCQEKQLLLLTQFAPANGFEEMIMWTEQGKHWKFPIDNETEMGIEENTGFHEHVFLDHHLKGFPTKGPVRHFMELVTVGLSKNPYITAERKIENIEWFRDYFKEKEDILRESGAVE